jgi:type IV secretory pathway protease TraF
MTKLLGLVLCGVMLGLGVPRVMDALGVLIVHTPSIAEGVYLRRPVEPTSALRIGDVVCLDATSRFAPVVLREGLKTGRFPAFWREEVLVKHVAAFGGASLEYERERGVSVDGVLLPNSKRKKTDLAGQLLPAPQVPKHVPEGYVWLASEHPDGFDSRYMGVVDVRALTCVAEALWTL